MTPTPAQQGPTGPSSDTVKTYIDVTKWTTTAAASVLVFGLDHIKDGDAFARLSFFMAGICLLAAVFSGALVTLWAVRYLALRDKPNANLATLATTGATASRLHHAHTWAFAFGVGFTGVLVLHMR